MAEMKPAEKLAQIARINQVLKPGLDRVGVSSPAELRAKRDALLVKAAGSQAPRR